ncbi:MAG: prepilin-type N-terminal cleavage/methylation domain-containing protein [Myxococcota bacterium]|nr:prepilin-type N-terminal cleavage/methylation domain-containing protein [Myxococcota bacterium]
MKRTRNVAGFTLVELMVVVALIGVLSAIAIPSFLTYQARSRRAESYTNLAAMAKTQKSFQATKGTFHDSGNSWPDPDPYGGLGVHTMTWDADSENAFGELGWAPEGRVFYSYMSNVCCANGLCFTGSAYGDVDGNGTPAAVMYVHPETDSDGTVVTECPSGLPGKFDFGTPTRATGKIYNQVATHGTTDRF